jgi:hypothetical protein
MASGPPCGFGDRSSRQPPAMVFALYAARTMVGWSVIKAIKNNRASGSRKNFRNEAKGKKV